MMKPLRVIAILVIVMMTALAANILINDSMTHGLGLDTFMAGSGSPWQLFINQDLFAGLLFAAAWMIWREAGGRAIDTVAWVWMFMWWGNIVLGAYVLMALRQADGDTAKFFSGRAAGVLRATWGRPAGPTRVLMLIGAAASAVYMVKVLAMAVHPITIVGSVLGFAPIMLSFVLLAFPANGRAHAG